LAALGAAPVAAADVGQHAGLTANTTITVVVTNQTLPPWALQRLAVQVHNSMSRAIQPFGTEFDVILCLPCRRRDQEFETQYGRSRHACLGSRVGRHSRERAGTASWSATVGYHSLVCGGGCRGGRYEFAPGAVADVRRAGAGLEVELAGRGSLYLPADQWVSLVAVGKDEFELATPRADRLHFDHDASGRIVGLTINPGPWPIHAHRLAAR